VTESASDRCRRYRRRILEVSRQVTAAHIAPAFSCLEIVDALYHDVMRPDDIFIMSKGHGCLAQYVVLEDLKWEPARAGVPVSPLLDSYCKPEGTLGAHPDYDPDLGIHASTGSLGHGLGIAMGQAYAEKLKQSGVLVYCLLSDGECQEGSVWEAAMVAINLGLDNLTVLVDANGWGGMERIPEDFPAMRNLAEKFAAFGWCAKHTDFGHDWASILHCVRYECPTPLAVVCKTVKGKGVSFIEAGQPLWHYRSPNDEEYAQAMRELA
jgi:transketolase